MQKPPKPGKPFKFSFPPAPRCGDEIIALRGITHGYNGAALMSNVDLTVARGDKIAFFGPNGAGKSTTVKILTGIYRPDGGTIRIDGEPVSLATPNDASNAGITAIHQETVCAFIRTPSSTLQTICLHPLLKHAAHDVLARRQLLSKFICSLNADDI